MNLSNCACGNPVEVVAGEDGGLVIVCSQCKAVLINLSDDVDAFAAEWNQSVEDRHNSELELIGKIRELMK